MLLKVLQLRVETRCRRVQLHVPHGAELNSAPTQVDELVNTVTSSPCLSLMLSRSEEKATNETLDSLV